MTRKRRVLLIVVAAVVVVAAMAIVLMEWPIDRRMELVLEGEGGRAVSVVATANGETRTYERTLPARLEFEGSSLVFVVEPVNKGEGSEVRAAVWVDGVERASGSGTGGVNGGVSVRGLLGFRGGSRSVWISAMSE